MIVFVFLVLIQVSEGLWFKDQKVYFLLISFNMPMILKYTVVLFLICGFSYGKMAQKCFTLSKVIHNQVTEYYHWDDRPLLVQVDLHCPNGLIHFGHMIFSIPKDKDDACRSEQCFNTTKTLKTCKCCEKPGNAKVCSFNDSAVDDQEKAFCEIRQNCNITVGIVDLSEHCATQIEYACDQGHCKSRWIEVNYECVAGMNINLLSSLILQQKVNVTMDYRNIFFNVSFAVYLSSIHRAKNMYSKPKGKSKHFAYIKYINRIYKCIKC